MRSVKNVGKPCAGESHARFDGRGLETDRHLVGTAPVPDPPFGWYSSMWTGRSACRGSGRDSVGGQGADRGGDGGRLVWVWPVGVVMVTWPGRSGSGRWRQPSASLIWLQAAHRPWPLGRVVGPPAARPVTWSMCRIGASHQGV